MSRRRTDGLKGVLYGFIVALLLPLLKGLFRLRIEGREHIAPDESYIIVARHRSYWDVFIMAAALGASKRIHFIARKGLMRTVAVVQPIIRTFSTVIDRENFGRADFRKMLEAIRRERLVGLFPEGTTRKRVDAKAGAVRFAMMTGKKILPVNIVARGPYPPDWPFRLPQITASIGESVTVDELRRGIAGETSKSELSRLMSDRLMERVDNA